MLPFPPIQYISDAMREFEGTSEEVRVTVADSELAIARGDVEGALKRLRKIPTASPHYTKVGGEKPGSGPHYTEVGGTGGRVWAPAAWRPLAGLGEEGIG